MRMLSFENQLHITSNFQFSVTFPFQTTTELSSTVHTPTCTAAVRRHTTQYSAASTAILGILKEQNCVHFSMVWLTLAHF